VKPRQGIACFDCHQNGNTNGAPREVEHHMAVTDRKIKTFPLRGIKDSPPYLHDGRLLTLDDTVEFFNLVLATKLSAGEKQDLVAFLQAL
jgi:cytochrome c peroxidase